MVLTDLREAKPAASLEPAEIAFGGPFIARGYLGRTGGDGEGEQRHFLWQVLSVVVGVVAVNAVGIVNNYFLPCCYGW